MLWPWRSLRETGVAEERATRASAERVVFMFVVKIDETKARCAACASGGCGGSQEGIGREFLGRWPYMFFLPGHKSSSFPVDVINLPSELSGYDEHPLGASCCFNLCPESAARGPRTWSQYISPHRNADLRGPLRSVPGTRAKIYGFVPG